MSTSQKNNTLLWVLVVAAVVVAGIWFFTARDNRTTGERLGDAAGELHNGVTDAGRELKDRTPAEKTGDAINDAAQDAKQEMQK